MGQKTHPIGFRLVRNRNWRSKWFANKQEFGTLLLEDHLIRTYLFKKSALQGASRISIRRMSEKVEITIQFFNDKVTIKSFVTLDAKNKPVEIDSDV